MHLCGQQGSCCVHCSECRRLDVLQCSQGAVGMFGNNSGAVDLACGNGAESSESCWVDCMTIVTKSVHNVLDTFDGIWGHLVGRIDVQPLNFGPVLYWNVL
jgi:hypothetical protein